MVRWIRFRVEQTWCACRLNFARESVQCRLLRLKTRREVANPVNCSRGAKIGFLRFTRLLHLLIVNPRAIFDSSAPVDPIALSKYYLRVVRTYSDIDDRAGENFWWPRGCGGSGSPSLCNCLTKTHQDHLYMFWYNKNIVYKAETTGPGALALPAPPSRRPWLTTWHQCGFDAGEKKTVRSISLAVGAINTYTRYYE
jgi:hypothetical protein